MKEIVYNPFISSFFVLADLGFGGGGGGGQTLLYIYNATKIAEEMIRFFAADAKTTPDSGNSRSQRGAPTEFCMLASSFRRRQDVLRRYTMISVSGCPGKSYIGWRAAKRRWILFLGFFATAFVSTKIVFSSSFFLRARDGDETVTRRKTKQGSWLKLSPQPLLLCSVRLCRCRFFLRIIVLHVCTRGVWKHVRLPEQTSHYCQLS